MIQFSKMNTILRRGAKVLLNSKPTKTNNCCNFGDFSKRFVHVEKRIEELDITLPPPASPKANYNIVCHSSGNMLYVSGHLPIKADGTLLTGVVGPESGGHDIEKGYEAARHCGLNIVSTLKDQLGDLDRVEQVVKVSRCKFVR